MNNPDFFGKFCLTKALFSVIMAEEDNQLDV